MWEDCGSPLLQVFTSLIIPFTPQALPRPQSRLGLPVMTTAGAGPEPSWAGGSHAVSVSVERKLVGGTKQADQCEHRCAMYQCPCWEMKVPETLMLAEGELSVSGGPGRSLRDLRAEASSPRAQRAAQTCTVTTVGHLAVCLGSCLQSPQA